jgi:hypothetical protein
MIPPITIEFHRQAHDDRTAMLHASMHRQSWFQPRRALGAWMVSTGLRLAPEERMHPRVRAATEAEQTPAHAGVCF